MRNGRRRNLLLLAGLSDPLSAQVPKIVLSIPSRRMMRYEMKRLEWLGVHVPNHPHHGWRHVALKDEILKSNAEEILVLGCGKGLLEFLLPDGLSCTSVDVSEREIHAAKDINRYKNNRDFRVGDIYNLDKTLGSKQFPLIS